MKFLQKIKTIITNAAQEAVLEAEKSFQSGEGQAKKQAAIAFVVNALPLPTLLKPILGAVLGAFIDATIETAVKELKSTQKE